MANPGTAAYVGRPVRWTGPPDRDGVSPSYRTAVAAGARRTPTAQERRMLSPGDEGTVIELVSAGTAIGEVFLLRFGGEDGYETEVPLPSRALVQFLDNDDDLDGDQGDDQADDLASPPAAGPPSPRRYAEYHTTPGPWWRRQGRR